MKKLLNTLYLPVIIADKDYNLIFFNNAFERFSKEVNVDYDAFLGFTKINIKNNYKKFTKPFEIPGKRIFIHAEIIDNLIIIHIETVRQALVNFIRREIINQFSSSISHIFYNLITIIKNSLEKETCQNKIIKESVNRMRSIVDIVNLYSSNISGYSEPQNYSLNKAINEAVNRNKPIWDAQAKLKKIKFEIQIKTPSEYIIKGSYQEMLLSLIHIIRNALEAMPKGGILKIYTDESKEGILELHIEDNGNGVDWASVDRVFEPFFTTKKLKRKGLGLSYAYGITRKHKGTIQFESEEHKGSKITISLPYKNKSETNKESEILSTEPIENIPLKSIRKILVVDDEKLIASTTAKIIEKISDSEVYTANSGHMAITIFTQHFNEIDLIISDLGMEEVTGFDVADFVIKLSKDKNITPPRFILYTGWGNHINPEELKAHGIEAVYTKPLSPKDFKKILNKR